MQLINKLQPDTFSSPFSSLQFRTNRSFPRKYASPALTFFNARSLCHLNVHCRRHKPNFKVIRGMNLDLSMIGDGEFLDDEDGDLFVETCITRNLPPVLTLERGLESIREEIEKLKLNPPCSSSGIYRFQVAVPPSAKALEWFCNQPESAEVFPQFFLSKESDNSSCKSLSLNATCGVFGVGAAIYLRQSSSCITEGWRSFQRYISSDSSFMTAYGFVDINIETESSTMKCERGSLYFFIPQVELDEHDGISILRATLAWNNSFLCVFREAVDSFDLSFHQISCHCWPTTGRIQNRCITSALQKFSVSDDQTVQMVYVKVLSLSGKDMGDNHVELEKASSSCQFCIRLSSTFSFARNMLNHAREMTFSLRDYANINTVWASMIIEECTRLGLTYFCLAPGSRSSPLAIAASTHPLTTCIACFDERSLAFHAVGYSRGSHKPAVVITSSGTAVSNLFPAVVEASQDFVPLLLLTADRPPELQDAGANQAINQVNHFGSFVRFFFSLPAPTDHIPARMVLTTIDSAVYWATSLPYGPVHINCPFREPLEDTPRKWMLSCLKGLDFWLSSAEPLTKYIQIHYSYACPDTQCYMSEVLKVIQGAKRGLLLIGAIHTEDEIWAALLLAKHLSWPVVADILSGLRLRKLLTSFCELEENLLFVDYLDHALISDLVKKWVLADVVIQVGSRITSKRISQMLEECFPFSYIMVDKHPCRHDPSHIVTHRVQSTISEFAGCLLQAQFPHLSRKWSGFLHAINTMVSWEISFQICSNCSLTEPYVAHVISKAPSCDSVLFMGNSMVIRDADMYGHNWTEGTHSIAEMMVSLELPCHWLQVAGNRGVSGIDGLLSTAIGFAVGCYKRVLCIVGDVSFLHDTNGLAILNQRMRRKPITILVINNHGGAIFSLLPIADRTESRIMKQFFYTSHNVSISKLCMAHGVKHLHVRTKKELHDALFISQQDDADSVIEVESNIDSNATFHSSLRKFSCIAADHALSSLSRISVPDFPLSGFSLCKIHSVKYSLYRVSLFAPPTSTYLNHDPTKLYREGFILTLSLEDGSVGFGEVAPLDFHKENLLDVEAQLQFLIHVLEGAKISNFLPLLKGSFSSWIWSSLGVPARSIFPSVRCGLEMAVLNAIAAMQGSSLLDLLHPGKDVKEGISKRPSRIKICALLDSTGTPMEVAYAAATLVKEGFSAIKLKVARRADPYEDAAVIQEVRKKIGQHIQLRADANKKWSYEEAIGFGLSVKDCELQYIEEPVSDEDDIIKFCEETGLPVALDETIDNIQEDPLKMLAKFTHSGIVAVVIKPSVVGGFENALLIARWAQQQGKMAVISAAFESGLSLLAYIQLCCYLEMQNADICNVMNKEPASFLAHGLGTYKWLKEDVTVEPLKISLNPCSGYVEASLADADRLLRKFQTNHDTIISSFTWQPFHTYHVNVESECFSCPIKVYEIGSSMDNNVLVFIHGFLGTGEEWIPIMKSMSRFTQCITFDLPGHGKSIIQCHAGEAAEQKPRFSVEVVADILYKLIQNISPGKVTLVGYSMGARIALYMALRYSHKIEGAVVISGSPGLKDVVARKIRRAQDDSKARFLVAHGLQLFLDTWYTGDLWKSLRGHPNFGKIVASRFQHEEVHSLAKVLSDLSIGRQPSLWEDLKQCRTPLLLIVGERDQKFKTVAQQMWHEIGYGPRKEIHEIVEIPNCGHAVHLENPLPVISALRKFLTRLKGS